MREPTKARNTTKERSKMLRRIIIIMLVAFLPAMADAESHPASLPSVKRMLLPGTPAWGQYTPSRTPPQQQRYSPPSPPAQFSPSFPWRTYPSPPLQQQQYSPPSPPAQFPPSFPWRTHPSPPPQQQQYSPPSPPAQFSPSFPWRTNPSPPPPTPAKKSPSRPPAESAKNMKCSRNPMVCWDPRYGGDGSPRTSYCCHNKCVDLLSDNKNCGMCKNKCKFATGCCNGICSNVAYDTNNCGRCGNRCGKGSRCVYGLCSYA